MDFVTIASTGMHKILVIMVEQEVLEDVDLQLVQYGVVVRQALLVLM